MEWTSSSTVSGAADAATTSSVMTPGATSRNNERVGRGVDEGEVGDDPVATALLGQWHRALLEDLGRAVGNGSPRTRLVCPAD
jgi:hypothetical protein